MKAPRTVRVALALAAILGCSGGAGGALGQSVTGVHVDAAAGSDVGGDGSPSRPYRTLTRALGAARAGTVVRVAAGSYGAGESFPVTVPRRVILQADAGAALEGTGAFFSPSLDATSSVGLVARGGSQIAGLRIRAPGGVAVWSEDAEGTAWLLDDELVDSDFGAVFAGTVQSALSASVVTGNAHVGVEILGDARPVLRGVVVASNVVGVAIRERARPDLGTASAHGGNRFGGNAACDVANETPNAIDARGNVWDADPYLITASATCEGGADIVNALPASGAVLWQDVPPGAAPIFVGAAPIELLAPAVGELLPDASPELAWGATGASLVVAGIFTEPIAVTAGRIANAGAMVWAWHTGLGTGREGAVDLADGVVPVGGSLSHTEPPVPLQRGRTYYWAVWAWDEQGTRIAAASRLAFFTVLN